MTSNIHSNNLIRILSIFLTPFIISYLSIFLLTESFELTLFHLGAFPVFSTLTVFLIFQYFFVYIQGEKMHDLYLKSSFFIVFCIAFSFILFFLLDKIFWIGEEFFLIFIIFYFILIFLYSYFKKKKIIKTYFFPFFISLLPVLYISSFENIFFDSYQEHWNEVFIHVIYFHLIALFLFLIFISFYNIFFKKTKC